MTWPAEEAPEYEPAHVLADPEPPAAPSQPAYPTAPIAQPVPGPLGAHWAPAPATPAQPAAYQAWAPAAYPWIPTQTLPPALSQTRASAPAWAGPTAEERVWAPAAHWLPLLTHWIGPLAVLLTVGRRSEWVRTEAAASLNWEITVAVLLAVSAGLAQFGVIGPALALAVIVLSVGLHIAGAVTASRGGSFRYPLALPIVR